MKRPPRSVRLLEPRRGRTRSSALKLWPKLKAIGHPTRAEIVALVAAAGEPPCASDLEAHFALAQPTIAHHLDILRKTGVLQAERRGIRVHYSIGDGLADAFAAFARELRHGA